ncbi:hypothetical protein [Halopseudomonas sp.]|uniref:hypothetical protein n=1 Tax=Halopseudomonas sp. TaxID=2901191 RepID=UPI0030036AE0
MIWAGLVLILLNLAVRAALYPAEYSLAGDPSNYPRIFYSAFNRRAYLAAEALTRWGGSILIAGSFVGFHISFGNLLFGGLISGALAGLLLPFASLMLALKIHPGFKRSLD